MTATDCLATTGTDTLLPFVIIAGVLLVAGVIAVFAARRRAGWAALVIVPLLLGGAFFGAGAPPAQAAGVPCPVPTETASPVVTETPLATETPTPTPEPTCTPTSPLADIVVDASNWAYRDDDDFDGYSISISDTDKAAIVALLAKSTSDTAEATLTADGVDLNDDNRVPVSVPLGMLVKYSGVGDFMLISTTTDDSFVYVPWQPIQNAVDAVSDNFAVISLHVSVAVPYSDGCADQTANLTFDLDFPTG